MPERQNGIGAIIESMCGRYTLTWTEERELTERFGIKEFCETRLVSRFSIAPSQDVAVIIQKHGRNILTAFKWGLIPSWAKDLKKTRPMINARIETIGEKPFFKNAIKNRRCLIPADGFFEWQEDSQNGQTEDPTYIYLAGSPIFAFAGLWDQLVGYSVPDRCRLPTSGCPL
jgi:putative SOS response-associated peptidase YedK